MSESLDVVFDAYGEDFENYALESDSYLCKCNIYLHLLPPSYFVVVVISYIMMTTYNLKASEFGPILIILSTLLTGIHILFVQKMLRFFDENDPAYGSMHLKRLKGRGENNAHYQHRYRMSSNNYLSRKKCGGVVSKSISYEILLASYGTLAWGFF